MNCVKMYLFLKFFLLKPISSSLKRIIAKELVEKLKEHHSYRTTKVRLVLHLDITKEMAEKNNRSNNKLLNT